MTINGGSRAYHARRFATAGRPAIRDTGYSHLTGAGKEEPGYGLYSYVILPSASPRGAALLAEIFRELRRADSLPAERNQLNVLYLPMQGDRKVQFEVLRQTMQGAPDKLGADYMASYYDYTTAQKLLYHMCSAPHDSVRDVCQGDMARGPYIFTYAAPASQIEPLPPPFLFVDLSDVHAKAFGELIAAFRAQVKREDISDNARIKTLRLGLLQVLLTAADLVKPTQEAVAGIVRTAGGGDDKK